MKTILLIAADSIRALLHKRLLVGLMVASVALTIGFSVMYSNVRTQMMASYADSADVNMEKVTKDMTEAEKRQFKESMEEASFGFQTFFYFVASFGGSLVALFIFGTAVTSEIRSGTIRITLAKPVSRTQFLLGKYAGAVAVMAAYTVVASASMLAFTHTQQLELSPAMTFVPWLMFLKQLMMGAVALLLSLFMHPLIAGLLAFFAGNGFYSQPNPLYYVLPSYGDFDIYREVLSGTLMSAADVGWLTLYAFDFAAVMLLLALWRFRTKEIV
jgi:ABC-type transport system involved in multi-copper enzyme maturation permease subunit